MPTSKPVRTTVSLDAGLHRALQMKATRTQQSKSEIVNQALRQRLREDEQDLRVARSRAKERSVSDADFLAKLKVSGTL